MDSVHICDGCGKQEKGGVYPWFILHLWPEGTDFYLCPTCVENFKKPLVRPEGRPINEEESDGS